MSAERREPRKPSRTAGLGSRRTARRGRRSPPRSSSSGSSSTAPGGIARGLVAITTSRDTLLTDYFGIGGIGAGCVNAGLLTLCACFVYYKAGAKMTGAAVACLFLVLGFALFGKNLLNVWFIVDRRRALLPVQGRSRSRRTSTPRSSAWRSRRSSRRSCSARASRSRVSLPLAVVTEPRHRVRPRARRGAALQGPHGIQPLQHGIHRRPRRHAGRRAVQVVRLRARPGLHLDDRQQRAARRVPVRSCSFR